MQVMFILCYENVYLVLVEGFKQTYDKENMYREDICGWIKLQKNYSLVIFSPWWKPK